MRNKLTIIIIAIISLAPLWFLITGSLMAASKVFLMPPQLFPTNPTLANYIWAFTRSDIFIWSVNTVLIVVLSVFGSVTISTMAGYAFSIYKLPKIIFIILLSGLMIPRISLLIPLFVVTNKIGISGTLWSVILPCIFSPVGIYLSKNYFDTVPRSLIESARIDGANELQVLRYVVAPVSKPIVTALALFASLAALQDWVWQSLQLQDTSRQTLLVGWMRSTMMANEVSNAVNPMGHAMAVGVLLLIPLLFLFIVANKYFIGAIEGAEK